MLTMAIPDVEILAVLFHGMFLMHSPDGSTSVVQEVGIGSV